MKFFETSKYHSFEKSTYIILRWIGIIGQLIAVNFVYFFLNSNFDFVTSNIIISFDFSKDPTFLHADFIYDKSGFLLLVIGVAIVGLIIWLTSTIAYNVKKAELEKMLERSLLGPYGEK